ncbi:hypothetical protein Tco_0826819 [Tanacetum coccineum]
MRSYGGSISYLHAVASEWKVLQYQWKPAGGKYTYVGRLYLTCGNHSTKQKLKERIKSLSGKIDKDKIKQDFEEIETINIELDHRVTKLIAENEHLKQTYKQLYDSIKPARIRSKEQCDDLINQVNIKSREISNLNASLLEKALAITILKDELRKLKGKALVDNNVLNHPSDPELHKHSKLNANSSLKCVKCNGCMLSDNHNLCVLDFINNVNARAKSRPVKKNSKRKVWKPTGKVFTNIGYIWRPTSRTFTIVGNAFPLTRITITTEVPLRKSSALDNKTPKPVITLVYSRKPRKSKTSVPVNNYKVIKFVTANNLESSQSRGSIVSNVPSSSLDECSSSGPALHEMTPATISSGLVPNPHPSTPFIPPSRTDWDMLFQPLFDEFLNPSPSVDHPANKDAPSLSNFQTAPETEPPVILNDVEEYNHDIEVAHMVSISAAYYMSIALFCLIRCFPHTVEPKTYKVALYSRLVGFEAMQEELNEFERLEVWELIPRPDKISQNPRGIFINQSKYALESLKKYGFDSCDPVDTPMVEKSKLDEDKEGKDVDPSHYCDTRRSTSGSMQLLGDILVSWSSKRQKSAAISSTEAEYIPLSGYLSMADIFTKALSRNRIKFLINKLGMRSFTPETLKKLADEVDE